MKERYLIDTDVLIDYFKGNPKAIKFLENPDIAILISAITVAELFAGVREGHERDKIESFISAFEFLPLTLEISKIGGLLKRDYGKSHGLGLADSLIAATSIITESTLITLNTKHFKMIKDVKAPYSKS
ncbi:MAG: type II toxin-antitoxin system VapC family toxin [bacterium]